MKYKLVLRGYKPVWWRKGDPIEYIMQDGKHLMELDLVTDWLPDELVERIYECLECLSTAEIEKWYGRRRALESVDLRISRPPGADKDTLLRCGCELIPISQ